MTMNQNQSKQVMKERLQYYRTNKCKPTETFLNNKPGTIIRNNEKGTCMLIDVAISGDRKVNRKEAENILIYKHLKTEIQLMWNVKVKVTPVITGATGTVAKSFKQYLNNILEEHEINDSLNSENCSVQDKIMKFGISQTDRQTPAPSSNNELTYMTLTITPTLLATELTYMTLTISPTLLATELTYMILTITPTLLATEETVN